MEEVVNEIKETKTKLAIAEREGDIARRDRLETYLIELQIEKNLLLQQQAPPALPPGFRGALAADTLFLDIPFPEVLLRLYS
eukprot:gene6005-8135_t